jgi:hypothetical protein
MTFEIEKAFTYVFDDPDWVMKVGILALLQFVPIIGQIMAIGYVLALLRNVAAGEARPLPAWDRFADMAVDGLKLFVIHLVYLIPLLLLCAIPLSGAIAAGVLSDRNRDIGQTLGALAGLGSVATFCIVMLYALAVAIISPAVTVLYSRTGSIAVGFNPGKILGYIRQYSSPYLTTLIIILLASFLIATLVGFIAAVPGVNCLMIIIGPIVTAYTSAFNGHLLGQLSRATA